MSYDNLSSVSQNVLKFYQQLTGAGMAKVKIVKNERDPPLFTGKLLIKFQNILRNTTQVIIRHRVKILFCHSRVIGLDMTENRIFTLCRMIT
jgi:hypothetical protein